MSDADTQIDWSIQIANIRRRYEETLRAGDTVGELTSWLNQVPLHVRDQLREILECTQSGICIESVETQVLSSAAVLAKSDAEAAFSASPAIESQSAVSDCRTFAGLSPDAMEALRQRLEERSFPLGTPLLRQGQSASGLHLLLSGKVDIVDVQTGARIDVDGAGSVMGEMSLLTEQPCSADVIATTDVHSLTLSPEAYRELKAAHPELEIALSQLVSDRLGGRKHDALCGKTIGDYRLIRCINRGGMGVVYEAQHTSRGDAVALKMLRHRFIYDDNMKSQFDQEAVLLEGLRHPNIVSFQEHFLSFRTRFLVLDLCDGADLFRLLRVRGPFDETTTRAVMGQIAKGLLYAQQAGVIHRDLKPANVLVDLRGKAMLTDFGLSKLLEAEVLEGRAVGTPAYMPPEQYRSENIGRECDWYALGCMACEMLTGKLLFRGHNWREMYEEKSQRSPSDQWPVIDASDELRQVIHGLLMPDPSDRRVDLEAISRWADEGPVRRVQVAPARAPESESDFSA